ncbi:hypothetical protein BDN72DRAFT_467612 [Pluteus cervinus]|uniref:Uncharacterized protein n=1 Tax=Pluteus cervinus TaxID=181527 RepID=A0ACD3A6D4_9AGAR|nr:hypothetical protein BDN72DRAFT_467612 [Pluteus cervinus]
MLLTDLHSDVLEEIVQAVKETHAQSLPALSLVSSAFQTPAQRLLFQSITIWGSVPYNGLIPPPRLIRLRDTLKSNSTLVTYIKDVKCIQSYIRPKVFRLSLVNSNKTSKHWIIDHGELLAEILQLLEVSSIHSFSIINNSNPSHLDWSNFHPTLNNALLGLFNKSTLTSLQLIGLFLPENVFSLVANLQDLAIGNFAWLPDHRGCLSTSHLPVSRSDRHCQLSSLQIIISPVLSSPIASIGPQVGLDLTRIRTLYLDFYTIPESDLTRFISLPRLRNLILTLPRQRGQNDTYLDLGPIVGLHTLTLSCNLFFLSTTEISWLPATLLSLPSHAPIRTLMLNLSVYVSSPIDDFEGIRILSRALSDLHQRFPDMAERIQVRIDSWLALPLQGPLELQRLGGHIRDNIMWIGCENVLELDIT